SCHPRQARDVRCRPGPGQLQRLLRADLVPALEGHHTEDPCVRRLLEEVAQQGHVARLEDAKRQHRPREQHGPQREERQLRHISTVERRAATARGGGCHRVPRIRLVAATAAATPSSSAISSDIDSATARIPGSPAAATALATSATETRRHRSGGTARPRGRSTLAQNGWSATNGTGTDGMPARATAWVVPAPQ